jgi:hypothetical protein
LIKESYIIWLKTRFFSNRVIVFAIFFVFALALTFHKHNKIGYFNYHSEIWGDKAGYYIYLPALFIYQFNSSELPDSIVEKTGFGFSVDTIQQKIKTKYTCGIAILQSPFYLVNHVALELFNKKNNGFHRTNFKMIDFIGVFYLVLGLFFLFKFLINYYDKKTVYLSLFVLFFTTNLYYYGIDETGMSHVYSFFLISLFLYLIKHIIAEKRSLWIEFIFGFAIGLILLIRPINFVALTAFFFIDISSFNDIKNRIIKIIADFRLLIITIFSVAIIIFPQLLYWKYTYGKWIYYSYENEGFINLLSPQLLKVWFSTLNGQFLYVPATFLVIIGLFFLYRRNKILSVYSAILFFVISYLFASWWSWNFGCGFGIRPYVDFFPIFTISLAALVNKLIKGKNRFVLFSAVIILLVLYNINLIYSYDGCWYGGIWDWKAFIDWVLSFEGIQKVFFNQ